MLTFGNALKLRRGGAWIDGGGGGGGWPTHYVQLTIPASSLSDDLSSFPVYVDMSGMPAGFWARVQDDGGDIVVTASDGTTRLPVDLVTIDTSDETGELHFKADLSDSADNVFRVYYGTDKFTPGPADEEATFGRNAVWGDYEAVYHLQEDPSGTAPQLIDSTGGHDMTTAGSMTSGDSVSGKLAGKAVDFDGSNDHATTPDNANLDFAAALTLSAWVKPVGVSGTQHLIAKFGDTGGQDSYILRLEGAAVFLYLNIGGFKSVSGGTLTAGQWAHVVGTYDGTNMRVYVNGTQANSSAQSGSINNSTSSLRLAAPGAAVSGARLAGVLDEARLRGTALSAAHIAAEYANQSNPSTFYTVGSEQAA